MGSNNRGFPGAKKSLGQHFLSSPSVARRIAAALRPAAGDLVFEIGPGRGALTDPLARSGASIVAYEIDAALAGRLRERYAGAENVEIVDADIRRIDLDAAALERGADSFKLAGNIPYRLTSTILIDLARWRRLGEGVLMVQREVGERILAEPGSRGCGILSIFLQGYFIIKKVLTVRPGSFTPPPKVMSVVLGFKPDQSKRAPEERPAFLGFLKGCFAHRRKKLRHAIEELLGGAEAAERLGARAGVDLGARPEQIPLDGWFRLYEEARRLGAAREA